MLSASPTTLAKSSLEEMLESLRRRDEAEKPKDLPPALPSRPTSKARLPSARRSLPTNFKIDENGGKCGENGGGLSEVKGKEEGKRKEKELGVKRNSFGSKKMRKDVDSPYNLEAKKGEERERERERERKDRISDAKIELKEGGKGKVELEENDNIGYFIKKVSVKWKLVFFCVCLSVLRKMFYKLYIDIHVLILRRK